MCCGGDDADTPTPEPKGTHGDKVKRQNRTPSARSGVSKQAISPETKYLQEGGGDTTNDKPEPPPNTSTASLNPAGDGQSNPQSNGAVGSQHDFDVFVNRAEPGQRQQSQTMEERSRHGTPTAKKEDEMPSELYTDTTGASPAFVSGKSAWQKSTGGTTSRSGVASEGMSEEITAGVLDKYLDLEKLIHAEEAKVNERELESKHLQIKDLDLTIEQLRKAYQQAQAQTKKEKADVDQMPSVRSHFQNEEHYNKELSREQEEYLDALNKEEVLQKELEGVQKQREAMKVETEAMEAEYKKLTDLYKEEDELLGKIFGGAYGSPLENELEEKLDRVADRKNRIQVANTKWTGGRLLIAHAQAQLKTAVQKWDQLNSIPKNQQPQCYALATEVRNQLIAASQNLTNANKYLDNVKFPYCALGEVQTLDRAVTHLYTDMRTPERHAHARTCYDVTFKRAVALLGWFDSVINNTIKKDMDNVMLEYTTAEKALRAERVRLIRCKIEGKDISSQDGEDTDYDKPILMPVTGAPRQSIAMVAGVDEATASPTPSTRVSAKDLPPPPSNEEIFGQMESLRKQHEKETEEYEKAQNLNKARMQEDLKEKLRARRNRRERQDLVET